MIYRKPNLQSLTLLFIKEGSESGDVRRGRHGFWKWRENSPGLSDLSLASSLMLLFSNIFVFSLTHQSKKCQSKFSSCAWTIGFVSFNKRPTFQDLLFILRYFHPVFEPLSWRIMHPGLGQIAFALNCGHRAQSGFGHFWVNFAFGARTGMGGLIHTLTLFEQKSRSDSRKKWGLVCVQGCGEIVIIPQPVFVEID
jgi:hypothetical protein